jgi:glyoxylase I family protein
MSHFGVGSGPDGMPWMQQAGMTVFQPFTASTDYFRADRTHMLNFRVDDLKTLVAGLRTAGVAVTELPDETYGLFAHLEDPDGNPIELWEPLAS